MFSARTTFSCSVAALLAATVAGCGGDTDASTPTAPAATVTVTSTPSPTPSVTATEAALANATKYANAIGKAVASATRVTTLTEKTDPNNLLGRPNGYVSAAVITDEGGDTSDPDPGVSYGATVEAFNADAEATHRSDYIQGILKDSPMFGTEYHYIHGNVLLRVSGELMPSVAKQYQAAFDAAAG